MALVLVSTRWISLVFDGCREQWLMDALALSVYLPTEPQSTQTSLGKACLLTFVWPSTRPLFLPKSWPKRGIRRVIQKIFSVHTRRPELSGCREKDWATQWAQICPLVNPKDHRNITNATPLTWSSSVQCGCPVVHSSLEAGRRFYLRMLRSSELILNCHRRPFIPTLHLPLQSLRFIIQIFSLGAIKSSFIFSMLSLAAFFLFLAYRRVDLLCQMPTCQTLNIHSHALRMCITTYSTVTNVMLFNLCTKLTHNWLTGYKEYSMQTA